MRSVSAAVKRRSRAASRAAAAPIARLGTRSWACRTFWIRVRKVASGGFGAAYVVGSPSILSCIVCVAADERHGLVAAHAEHASIPELSTHGSLLACALASRPAPCRCFVRANG